MSDTSANLADREVDIKLDKGGHDGSKACDDVLIVRVKPINTYQLVARVQQVLHEVNQ